ncbi:MAG TPA: hypothetical protein VKG82_01660 [Solirubrobacteraceae bacterium]|nr:hypothetical protein [Solirubrobacteraceae bacterium]
MHDFEANEDLARLPDAGEEQAPEQPDRSELSQRPPIVRRVCELRYGHPRERLGWLEVRGRAWPAARLRGAARESCPAAARAALMEMPSRRCRRQWSTCHGRPPGSLS